MTMQCYRTFKSQILSLFFALYALFSKKFSANVKMFILYTKLIFIYNLSLWFTSIFAPVN